MHNVQDKKHQQVAIQYLGLNWNTIRKKILKYVTPTSKPYPCSQYDSAYGENTWIKITNGFQPLIKFDFREGTKQGFQLFQEIKTFSI